MANDTFVYDEVDGLRTSDYAEMTSSGDGIRVRGSRYIPYDWNYFTPAAARRLGRYILELAGDTDGIPDPDDRPGREVIAARRVSAFFDTLIGESFGPELTRAITVAATPAIVTETLAAESEY